jgi:hypothetical protein
MDINQAWEFCQSLARKEGSKGRFSPAEFNGWATFAQSTAIAQRLRVVHHDTEAQELLEPLLYNEEIVVASSMLPVPANCLEIESIATLEGYEVDILPPSKFEKRRNSALLKPTKEYPIVRQMSGAYWVLPAGIPTLRVYYYKRPLTPIWAYDVAGTEFIYKKQGSQDFQVHEKLHEEICVRILFHAGVNLSNDLLLQYGLQQLKPSTI